jgi:excisionase family DNA binding protein
MMAFVALDTTEAAMSTPDAIPQDLIPLSEACKLGPRPARGARRHRSTVLRWVLAGRLRGWKSGGNWYVSKAELQALLRPECVQSAVCDEVQARLEAEARAAETDRVLRAHGIRR